MIRLTESNNNYDVIKSKCMEVLQPYIDYFEQHKDELNVTRQKNMQNRLDWNLMEAEYYSKKGSGILMNCLLTSDNIYASPSISNGKCSVNDFNTWRNLELQCMIVSYVIVDNGGNTVFRPRESKNTLCMGPKDTIRYSGDWILFASEEDASRFIDTMHIENAKAVRTSNIYRYSKEYSKTSMNILNKDSWNYNTYKGCPFFSAFYSISQYTISDFIDTRENKNPGKEKKVGFKTSLINPIAKKYNLQVYGPFDNGDEYANDKYILSDSDGGPNFTIRIYLVRYSKGPSNHPYKNAIEVSVETDDVQEEDTFMIKDYDSYESQFKDVMKFIDDCLS